MIAASGLTPPCEFIDVDGVLRPCRNSGGSRIASNAADISAFWAWFGNSAMTDEQGRPLLLYHGTRRAFSEFKPSVAAFYGAGIYFTRERSAALDFAEEMDGRAPCRVIPVYGRFLSPFIYRAPPADREPTNVTLARELLGEGAEFDQFLRKLNAPGWYTPTREFRDALHARGHDGLVVHLDGETTEYIAFDASQIGWTERIEAGQVPRPAAQSPRKRRM